MNSFINWLKQLFNKIATDKGMIGQYWKWLLLGMIIPLSAQGVPCDSYGVDTAVNSSGRTYSKCICFGAGGGIHGISSIWNFTDPRRGQSRGLRADSVHECSDEFDSACNPAFGRIEFPNENSTIYLKSSREPNDYYKCDWTKDVGFSNARKHIPSLPKSSNTPTSSPQPVNANTLKFNWIIPGLLSLFIFFGVTRLYHHRFK